VETEARLLPIPLHCPFGHKCNHDAAIVRFDHRDEG